MSNFLKATLEAFEDGSTYTGTYYGMKAKLGEMFKENTDQINKREIHLKELTAQSETCRNDLSKNIDIREAITYVPLLSLAIHISINGEVIKNTNALCKHLKKLNELTDIIGTKYYPTAINFITGIADELAHDKYDATDVLGETALGEFIKHNSTENFLGEWRLTLKDGNAVFTADRTPVKASFLKPLHKENCLQLLDAVDSLLVSLGKYGSQATHLNEAFGKVNKSIKDATKERAKLFAAITSPSEVIKKSDKEIKLTIKTILHCVEWSISRMH